jgi:uncharacterized NAD(P)/FAD-binding protein YdhS
MRTQRTIAIIGGGVSGSLTAYHLVRQHVAARVVLIDPKTNAGIGLAYSTPSLRHLLNVAAGKISALPDQPNHFVDWLQKNYDASMTAADFAPRAVFGRYIQSLLSTTPAIEHRQTSAVAAELIGGGVELSLADGTKLLADAVVVATGNFDPAPLRGISDEAIKTGAYCHSAWVNSTYAGLEQNAPVALIGAGLTAVDVLLRLRETGYRGQVLAISRHGVFPHRHASYEPLSAPIHKGPPPATARELLHQVHSAIRSGLDWRAVIDSLRDRTNELWLALPLVEQKRFRRHLQRRWDVVRHRMAPPVADAIDAELAAGTLVKMRGSLHGVASSLCGARVQFRQGDRLHEIDVARVINCTGPNIDYRSVGSSLLTCLFEKELVVPGPHGSGLWTDAAGRLKASYGRFSELLFHVGPGRQGTLLESIAVPELRNQAKAMAELLSVRFAESAAQEATRASVHRAHSIARSRVGYECAS